MPQRDAVGRPVQQPATKHACLPMPMPISNAGVAAARKAPAGSPVTPVRCPVNRTVVVKGSQSGRYVVGG